MVGAAGFPCGIFPDVKILRAGPRGFCLARKVPFFCAQTKTSLRPSPPDAGKAVCLLRRPNKKGTAVKQFLLVNGRARSSDCGCILERVRRVPCLSGKKQGILPILGQFCGLWRHFSIKCFVGEV